MIKIKTAKNSFYIPQLPHLEVPILSYDLVKDCPDVSDQLPGKENMNLPEDCTIIGFRSVPFELTDSGLDSTEAVLRLTQCSRLEDINSSGAINAAIDLSHDRDEKIEEIDPSLKRFEAVHGRDALEIAMRLGSYYPGMLENTVLELATTQGVTDEEYDADSPFRQEEAGRIILIDRDENEALAQKFSKELGWGFPFYGSIDATPTFLIAIDRIVSSNPSFWDKEYKGRAGISTIRQSFNLASEWLLKKLEDTTSGYLEFQNKDPRPNHGMDAQSWRDSAYAYIHRDGSRANLEDGVASFDVQVDTYLALKKIARHCSDKTRSKKLSEQAEQLRVRVIEDFWVDNNGEGYFALGLDKDPATKKLRQLQVKTSSISKALLADFLRVDNPYDALKAESVANHIISSELLAYGGVRTLAKDEAGYHPDNYHTGAVWPWDSAQVADSLEEKGFTYLAWEIRGRILRTVNESGAYPEFVSGTDRNIVIPNLEVYARIDETETLFLLRHPPQLGQSWTISAIYDIRRKAEAFLTQLPEPSVADKKLYFTLNEAERATNLIQHRYESSFVNAA